MSTLTLQPKIQGENSQREISLPEREHSSYYEIPSLRHETHDVLKQLDANIQLLEDLGGRLTFVLTEVRGMIRR